MVLFFHSSLSNAYGPPNYLPDGSHPRLLLSSSKLSELNDKYTNNTSQWADLKSYCDYYIGNWPGSVEARWYGLILGMALMYQVTGDTTYSNRAKQFLDDMVANCDLNNRNTFRGFGNIVAIAYDWLYPTLSSDQKTAVINKLNSACTSHQGTWSSTFTDSDQVVGNAIAMIFHGIATYGDNPEALTHLEFGRTTLWNDMISEYISHFRGGIWPEGWKYGANTLRLLCWIIDGLNTGTGENRWLADNFADDISKGLIHSTLPNFLEYFPYSDLESAEYTLGYRQRNLAVVLSLMAGNENQEFMRWWITHCNISVKKDSRWIEILYYDPTGKATDYRPTISKDYFALGSNVILSRDGFDSSSTWVSFMSGWSGVDHQQEDANTFQIFRNGEWLSKETTGYGGPAATIEAHNGVMIDNAVNDGPHVFRHAGAADIKKHEFTGCYVYAVGDAKNRYNSDYYSEYHVQVADREFVYIKPNYIIVYDRISTTDNSKFKKLLQHYMYEPTITGTTIRCDTGNQRIFTKILIPEDLTIDKIDELVYWSGVPAYQISDSEKKWHILATPGTIRATESFLTVNYLTDSNTMPDIQKINTANTNMIGSLVKDSSQNQIVMFSSDPSGAAVTTDVSYTVDTSAASSHILFGLQPNTLYNVNISGVGSNQVQSSGYGSLMFVNSSASSHDYTISVSGIAGVYPAPPTDIALEVTATDAILTWSLSTDDGAGDNDVTGYKIYRSSDDITYTSIATAGSGVTTYTDSNPGGVRYYKVAAVDGDGYESSLAYQSGLKAVFAPYVQSITSTTDDGYYKEGDTINVTINFSEAMTLANGNLIITLETGATDRTLTISSIDNPTTASGTYTVQAGDTSSDLTINSLSLSNPPTTTLQNGDGDDVSLSTIISNLSKSSDIVVDTTKPSSSVTSIDYSNGTFTMFWTASDATAGLASTELWYKKGSGGSWSATGETRTGTGGTISYSPTTPVEADTYYFATQATDKAGNVEDGPSGDGDISIEVSSGGGGGGSGGGGGCFIATEAFGSGMDGHVKILSEFRDKRLVTNPIGRGIINTYYKLSPPVANYLHKHPLARAVVRYTLVPVTGMAYLSLYIHPLALLFAFIFMLLTGVYCARRLPRSRVNISQ